ncbi:MAG: DUF4390 domain-containing protein [Candidatus Thiothrix putei]|uniref:DUF4390 domain-containing protein n=1 Tax=Candidatus Thiothrix putei TaxID=3080811 RepID=A0AA95HEL6_9GAMM|nr:MAG: DUF4390 domain-containing protein [Candidatus Thiothrix putei]
MITNLSIMQRCLLTGLLLCALWGQALAAESHLQFREFSIRIQPPKQLLTNFKLDVELSDYLREGLLNGLTLQQETRFTLEWHNTWWWNTQKPLVVVKTELKYHPLSKQYQVVRPDTKENWNFPNLSAAIEQMGTLSDYRLPALPEDAWGDNAAIFVTATLTQQSLELPLKLKSLFSDRYSLESDGVLWPIP